MFWMAIGSSDNVAKEKAGSSVKYEGYTKAEYSLVYEKLILKVITEIMDF